MGYSVEQIASKLEALWKGTEPGSRLAGKTHYAALLGVDPRTVGKALDVLTDAGVIYWRQDGAYLSSVLMRGIDVSAHAGRREHDVEEFRRMIECAVVGLAAEHYAGAPLAARQALDAAMRALRHSHALGDLNTDIAADVEFHMAIFRLVRNPIVRASIATVKGLIEAKIKRNLTRFADHPGFRRATHEQHEQLYLAVTSGDRLAAIAAMTAQVDYVSTLMRSTEPGRAD